MKAPDVVLSCECTGCMAIPELAPRIYVPAKATGAENHHHTAVTLAFPHLHYCKAHWETHVTLATFLDEKARSRIEERGKKIWPQGVRPDFDAALIEPLGVWSAEYGRYMERIGLKVDGLGYSFAARMFPQRHV